jgi:hypothetical protein
MYNFGSHPKAEVIQHCCQLCGDLGLITLMLMLHLPSTAREEFVPGKSSVKRRPLVDPQLVLPLLHIKLGLVKNFVKTLDKNSDDPNT